MKLAGFISLLILGFLLFISCQRELSFENVITGYSTGTIKTVSGDCMPSGQSGIFQKGAAVDSSNYIYVDIGVVSVGSYLLVSDTVNGLHFDGAGVFGTTGVQTVRLHAHGIPIANGTVPYNIAYNGQSCIVNVLVTDTSRTASQYYFGNVNGACTGVTLVGVYKAGVAMAATNNVMVELTVTTTGTYNISTNTINGVTFSGTGAFSTTGTQEVSLTSTGIPATGGDYAFNVSGNSYNCSFQVTFAN